MRSGKGTTFVFELRAHTQAAIASYPSVPVIYPRAVLRAAVGLMLGVAAAGLVLLCCCHRRLELTA